MITVPTSKNISNRIEPNYSTWQQIELSYQCAKYAIDNKIEGDFVECGVACGNNLAAMCLAGGFGIGYDSFEGIPWAGENDTEQPGIGRKTVQLNWKDGIPVKNYINGGFVDDSISSGVTVHDIEDVKKNFERWGLSNYSLVKGWFQNTLPLKPDFPISVLRLDGDLYESTLVCLKYLYPWLSKGGILIIDDWQLEGCQKAFNDYFLDVIENKPKLILDNGVTYWQK